MTGVWEGSLTEVGPDSDSNRAVWGPPDAADWLTSTVGRHAADRAAAARLGLQVDGKGEWRACVSHRPRSGGESRSWA